MKKSKKRQVKMFIKDFENILSLPAISYLNDKNGLPKQVLQTDKKWLGGNFSLLLYHLTEVCYSILEDQIKNYNNKVEDYFNNNIHLEIRKELLNLENEIWQNILVMFKTSLDAEYDKN